MTLTIAKVLVIDCGFVKLRAINPKNGIETLMTVPVSKSSAEQRAGRAGRVRPGKCFRLYPESEFEKLMPATVPEIQRTNLASVVLQLKALGVNNVVKFDYVSVSTLTSSTLCEAVMKIKVTHCSVPHPPS